MDTVKELFQLLLKLGTDPVFIVFLQVCGAMLSTLAVMQGVKWVIKAFWPIHWKTKARTALLFIAAFYIGHRAGIYFVHSKEWAMAIGILNPIVYFALVQYARVKNRVILLSVLKMRPVIERNGEWQLHETQTFKVTK